VAPLWAVLFFPVEGDRPPRFKTVQVELIEFWRARGWKLLAREDGESDATS